MRTEVVIGAVVACLIGCAISTSAEDGVPAAPLGVGDTLGAISLEDQFGEKRSVDDSVKGIFFTRDMDAGDAIKASLAKDGQSRLDDARSLYVADVSRMPALIRRMFAEPAMRKRGYAMLLDRSGEVTSDFPGEDGNVTLLTLESRRIAKIEFLAGESAVTSALAALAQGKPEGADGAD